MIPPKVLQTETFTGVSQNVVRLNTSKVIAKGVYIIFAEVDGTRYLAKVFKE